MKKHLAWVLGILIWSLCQSDALDIQEYVDGPLYSVSDLRQRDIMGARLGMTEAEMRTALLAHGFAEKFRKAEAKEKAEGAPDELPVGFYRDGWNENLSVSYDSAGDGMRRVSRTWYYKNQTEAEREQIAERRREALDRFGQPSHWLKFVSGGKIADVMHYVTTSGLRDDNLVQSIWSCSVDWTCDQVLHRTDCRPMLAAHHTPVLTVSFGISIWFRLDDYGAIYRALMRDRKFRNLDVSGAVCPIPGVH